MIFQKAIDELVKERKLKETNAQRGAKKYKKPYKVIPIPIDSIMKLSVITP